LDTSDFIDELNDDEDNYSKNVQLNHEEMLKLLNIKDEQNNEKENENNDEIPFIGISFDSLKPKMTNIYKNGEVDKLKIYYF
jgi:hypothetical protein